MRQLSLTCLTFLLACLGTTRADYPVGYSPEYLAAVAATRHTYPDLPVGPIADLTAITVNNPDLIWYNDQPGGEVLMACFTDFIGYDTTYASNPSYRPELWASAAPELWSFLQDTAVSGSDAAMRTKQLLGMPLSHQGDRVVEFWVSPDSLFRPALDPSLAIDRSPTSLAADTSQYTVNYANWTYPTFDAWRQHQFGTYDAAVPYPWTELGYTYDWGGDSPVGLTEFIIKANSQSLGVSNPARVQAVVSIGSYRYYDRQGNFYVTADCDTIWAGTRYTPQGEEIVIDEGATVYQGITISSGGYRMTNWGTILGPGKNFDRTLRGNVVELEHGGQLLNGGLIDGREGGAWGIVAAEGSTESLLVGNLGEIRGHRVAIRTADGDDLLVNLGRIEGDILTGAGDDVVALLGGEVVGDVDGGDGGGDALLVMGEGDVLLDGDVRGMEALAVESGTAVLPAGNVESDVVVAAGAALRGQPRIEGDLLNAGTVIPGSGRGAGAIRVGGDYAQLPGSALRVGISKAEDTTPLADRIEAQGDVLLDAGSRIEVGYAPDGQSVVRTGDLFTVAQTPGTIVDGGVEVVDGSPFIAFSATMPWTNGQPYQSQRLLQLQANRTSDFAPLAHGRNARSMAAAFDRDADTAGGPFANLVNELLFMDEAEFNAALDGLSPGGYLATYLAATRTAQFFAEDTADYLRARRMGRAGRAGRVIAPVPPAETAENPWSDYQPEPSSGSASAFAAGPTLRQQSPDNYLYVYAAPFGLFYGQPAGPERVGFQANSAGVQMGIDTRFDGAILGLMLGYADTDLRFHDDLGGGDLETMRAGPYLSLFADDWFLDGSLTYGYHDHAVDRRARAGTLDALAHGQYRADDLSLYLGSGLDLLDGAALFAPVFSLQYVYYAQGAFEETGAGGGDLAVERRQAGSLRSRLGFVNADSFCIRSLPFTRELFGGWAHEYLADQDLYARFAAGSTSFLCDRAGMFRDSGYFGGTLMAQPNRLTSIYLRYQGELSEGGHFHAVELGTVVDF